MAVRLSVRDKTPSPRREPPSPSIPGKCDAISQGFFKGARIGVGGGTVMAVIFCAVVIQDAATSQTPRPIHPALLAGVGVVLWPIVGAIYCGLIGSGVALYTSP